jgi:hypothetical protein
LHLMAIAGLLDLVRYFFPTGLVTSTIDHDLGPSEPNVCAIAAPIPFDEPVTAATLPFSCAIPVVFFRTG